MDIITYPHIEADQGWNARISGTRLKVRAIAEAWVGAESVAAVQAAFPSVSPAQIHAALTYYYDHKAIFDSHVERLKQLETDARAQFENSPAHQRLVDAKQRALSSGM